MNNKTRPSKVYTITNMSNVRNEKNYTIKEEAKNNPQCEENFVAAKYFHKAKNKLASSI
jgi:hypothetical protein